MRRSGFPSLWEGTKGWVFLLCSLIASPALADFKPIPLSSTAVASGAQVTFDKGIEFVTIGSAGNAPWPGNGTSGDRAVGRGSVAYEYKIGRFEVTTSQWVSFFNAAYDRPSTDWLPHLSPPGHWGAVPITPNTATGRRWAVPTGNEMIPVGNISWRMAAMYANWLHNDQSSDRNAFLNGAYDVSTFTFTPAGRFRDQLTHNPGAKFWVPTWDEWLKAAHFDPNKAGAAEGGTGVSQWWNYSTTSEIAPIPGAPGTLNNGFVAQANFAFSSPNPFAISLGAYPTVQSPWGLLDTSGATGEWTEEALFSGIPGEAFPVDRVYDGSWWVDGSALSDTPRGRSSAFPSYSAFDLGFRLAAAVVPGPSCIPIVALGMLAATRRRRRVALQSAL
ncbi:MAG: SUMF1/EgtB/PvdO family nonheme iron enzyme [Phycisphaerales bacterium]